jgi:hypothetical protein
LVFVCFFLLFRQKRRTDGRTERIGEEESRLFKEVQIGFGFGG